MLRFPSLPFVAVVCLGCEALHPPEITAETVTTTRMTAQGADVEAALEVYNPNKSALTASSVESKVTIGGKPDIARAIVTEVLVMPAGERKKMKLPIRVEWTDPAAMKALADAKQPAPYSVVGTVHYAGKESSLQTPFKINGSMTIDELASAAGTPAKPAPSAAPSARPSATPPAKR